MIQKFEDSKSTGVHHQLSRLVGSWQGTTKTWFEPGEVADESPVSGRMRLILGGRFVLHEYIGKFGDKSTEGVAIYGYHLALKKYQCVWVDSFHTGSDMIFSEGERGANDFSMLGSCAYVTPEIEQHWGWRTDINIKDDNEIIITAYNISPEGEEAKATETIYKRVE